MSDTATRTTDDSKLDSLGDIVTDRLRDEILSGKLRPGTRLVERTIAERLGVSRSPVREALHRLEEAGLAQTLGAGGAFVSLMNVDEVREIFEVRAALERWVGRLVAAHIDESTLRDLRGFIARMSVAAKCEDVVGQVQADAAFHAYLARLSGNERLQRMITRLHSEVVLVIRLSIEHGTIEQRLRDHDYLVTTLERRNPTLAAIALEDHVLEAGANAITALKHQLGHAEHVVPRRVAKVSDDGAANGRDGL